MATYKAEFLHHHHKRRLRPVTAYSLGLIHHWTRIGKRIPGLVNTALTAPVLGTTLNMAAEGQLLDRLGLDWTSSTPDAAVWPGRSASRPGGSTRSPWPPSSASSCRTQIEQLPGERQALHPAEVVALANRKVPLDRGGPVEATVPRTVPPAPHCAPRIVAAAVAAAAVTVGALARSRRR